LDAGALLIATIAVLIPGIGASLALHRPGEVPLATRIALSFGLGYAAVALSAVVLEVLHVLSEASFIALLAAVTGVAWMLVLRRAGLGAHMSALAEELRQERWLVLSGLAMLVAFAVMRLRFSPLINFSMFGPWRYWADGLEIADAGRVPHLTLQWGATYTPTVSKVILNSYHAGLSYLIGSAPLPAMGALLWVAAVGFAAALWSLGRELGLRYTAALLPPLVLVLLDNELHRDLDVYTAENVGRMAAVCALALGVRTLRTRGGRAETIATGVLFAVAAGSHGIPAFVMILGLGCYAVALMLVEGDRRGIVLRLAAVAAVTGLVWGASVGLSGGDVGFQGAKGSNRYAAFGAGVDPTASLFTGALVTRPPDSDHWYIAPDHLLRGFVASAITRPASDLWLWLVPAGTLVLALAALWRFPEELRPLPLSAWLLGALLIAVALLFSYRYSTYIPGTFGPHRLYDYACLLLTLVVLACLEGAIGLLTPVRRWLPAAVATVLVLGFGATAAVAGAPARHGWQDNGRKAVAVTDWVDAHLPCGSRLLVDRLTLGTFAAQTGRVSVAEGMGPYLRPSELHTVLDIVLGAHAFFRDPAAHAGFLRAQAVDYVLVVKDVRIGSMVDTLEKDVDPARFHGLPFLKLVHSDDNVDVYRVEAPGSGSTSPPNPAHYPGLECRRP
jgi:hypothetical protein